jgi:hypothetical protein
MTLAGNLDPATGIFYRAPEHPRLRAAQARDKGGARKGFVVARRLIRICGARCSGDHLSCAVSRAVRIREGREGPRVEQDQVALEVRHQRRLATTFAISTDIHFVC